MLSCGISRIGKTVYGFGCILPCVTLSWLVGRPFLKEGPHCIYPKPDSKTGTQLGAGSTEEGWGEGWEGKKLRYVFNVCSVGSGVPCPLTFT